MSMPKPGNRGWEEMVDFMRADLESDMGYTKIKMAARKLLKEQGRDFEEEFEKWKDNRTCVVCKGKVDRDSVKREFGLMFMQVDFHGVKSLTKSQRVVYEGMCCSRDCSQKL